MESMWTIFSSSIADVAALSCSNFVVGACCNGNLKTCWWTPAVKEAVRLKKKAFKAWLAKESL